MCNLQACRPNILLRLRLEQCKLAKQIFILDIEQGQEVFIPKELSQDNLPMTFRYYDFIINLLQDNLSQETRDLHAFKNIFRINFYKNENILNKVLEKIGVSGGDGGPPKLTFRYQNVNEKEKLNINHHVSHQVLQLQRSKYLTIDDDVQRIQVQFDL